MYKGRGIVQLTGRHSMANSGSTITINGASANTIGLTSTGFTGFSAQQIQSLKAVNPITFSFADPNVVRYEIVESKQDLLALSVAWSRYRADTSKQAVFISNMLDDSLFSYVNQADIDHANVIRDYYSKKFTVLALKNIELSAFRKDLKDLVTGDGKKFKESLIPLAYRMPEFYEYDVEFEDLLFAHNREVTDFESDGITRQTKRLSLVKTFMVNNKKSKRKEYWFADEFNNLIVYYVEVSNPLRGLLDQYVKDDIKVSAVYRKRERDGYEYIKMHSVDFG